VAWPCSPHDRELQSKFFIGRHATILTLGPRLLIMLIAFSVAPSGSDGSTGSVSEAVAAAVRIVRDSGLPHQTDSMFTTIEGSWDECMDVVRRACQAVGEFGPRVSLVLKADIRPGFEGELTAKVQRLEQVLERQHSS
jgi:uncharacterized protein YqgV (UPF0045/DUF77 family)